MLANVRAAIPLLDSEDRTEDASSRKPQNYAGGDEGAGAGIRGRKTFAFWTLVTLLLILAAGNLLLTVTILSVLHLGQGMESVELVPDASVVRLSGDVRLEHVYQRGGRVRGFRDVPVKLEAVGGGGVGISLAGRGPRQTPHRALGVSADGISIDGVSSFSVVRPATEETVFGTSSPSYNLPGPGRNLRAKVVSAGRVVAPAGQNLTVRSDSTIGLHGTEGAHMDAKETLWSADQDIYLRSINGSIVLSAREGIFIDMKNVPVAKTHDDGGNLYNDAKGQFKVCVCMPKGKLFRLPVPSGQARVSCSHVNLTPKYNPCL